MSARCTFAHVDLAALQSNFRAISEFLANNIGSPKGEHYDNPRVRDVPNGRDVRSADLQVGPTPGIIAVVKANAYGHGAPAVARGLRDAGAQLLACADIEEAIVLRRAGVTADILIFGALGIS